MESNQESKSSHEGGCCRKERCCGGKAVAALVLLLIGGIVGFLAACHYHTSMCPMHDMGMMGSSQKMPGKHPGK